MNSTAQFNPVLSALARSFLRSATGFVGHRIFPSFSTGEVSSDYPTWKRENDLLVPQNIRRAPGAPFARSLPGISDDRYACVNWGHETPVPDEIRKKYAAFFSADQSAIQRNVDIIRVNHEKRCYAKCQDGSVPNGTPGTKWSNSGATPRANVNVAKEAIRAATGMRANLMVMAEPVRLALLETNEIKNAFKYTQGSPITLTQLAAYFGVDEVLIAEQIAATSQEGQTLSSADIWSDTVMLLRSDASPDLQRPTFGRTFEWNITNGPEGISIETYRDDAVKSDIHRSEHHTDEKIVAAEAGYRIDDVL